MTRTAATPVSSASVKPKPATAGRARKPVTPSVRKKPLPPALADRLKQTINGLNALIPLTDDEAERRALRASRRECMRQWEMALRIQAGEHHAELAAASRALLGVNREITAARRDLRRIVKVIEATAAVAKIADRALVLAMKVM